MSLFSSTTIPVLEQLVNFTESRHGVLAGNIANMDTPGYKTRDLSVESFNERLKGAIEKQKQGPVSTFVPYDSKYPSSGGRMQTQSSGDPFAGVKEGTKSVLRHDQSDVALETQVTELAKNQTQHNTAIAIMISQFKLLNTAISERV